jgi:hypothetical protein
MAQRNRSVRKRRTMRRRRTMRGGADMCPQEICGGGKRMRKSMRGGIDRLGTNGF